jgi:hypothetical protein
MECWTKEHVLPLEEPITLNALETFMEYTRENKIDPALGYLLQLPLYMQTGNDVFEHLRQVCKVCGVKPNEQFVQDLADAINKSDVQEITPMANVVSKTKADALAKYKTKQDSWGIHLPFFFQTCPGSVFFIYRTSTDALLAMLKILREKKVNYTKPVDGCRMALEVNWILEHVVEDNPCYALYDLDDYPHLYHGRISDPEIKQLISGFPGRFITLLIESGCIDNGDETLVEVTEKDKSRWVQDKNCQKFSFHYIISTFASKAAHRLAVASSLRRPFNDEMSIDKWWRQMHKTVKDGGDYSSVPDIMLTTKNSLASLLSMDPAALPGGPNGITTFYSKKRPDEAPPIHGPSTTYCMGLPITVSNCPYPPPHDFSSAQVSDQDRLRLLRSMSYTIPKHFMTFYTEELIQKASLAASSVNEKTEVSPFILSHLGLAGESNPAPLMRVNPDTGQK